MPIYLSSAVAGAYAFLKVPNFSSRFISRNGVNLFVSGAVGYFTIFLVESLIRSYAEPHFVASDILVEDLSKKYNFTVFDFANSKKEAYLKHLKQDLIGEMKFI